MYWPASILGTLCEVESSKFAGRLSKGNADMAKESVKHIIEYQGRPIEDLSRNELIAVVKLLHKELKQYRKKKGKLWTGVDS